MTPIIQLLGATYDAGSGLYTVPCSLASAIGSINIGFGNTIISVPYRQFIFNEGGGFCILGAQPAPAGEVLYVLGDTFMRSVFGTSRPSANLLSISLIIAPFRPSCRI